MKAEGVEKRSTAVAEVTASCCSEVNGEEEKQSKGDLSEIYDEALMQEAVERFSAQEKEDAWRMELRSKNVLASNGSGEEMSSGAKREKSVAKVQKFVSRLRRFTEVDRDPVTSELNKLDVAMHLSEVADALCDGTVKQKDVPAIVEVCSLLFQQYGTEFSSTLCSSVIRTFKSSDVATPATALKRRSLPRLMIELILVGVVSDMTCLGTLINELCEPALPPPPPAATTNNAGGAAGSAGVVGSSADVRNSTSALHLQQQSQLNLVLHNIGTIEFLCRRFGAIILGEPGNRQQLLGTVLGRVPSRQCVLPKSVRSALRTKLIDFYRGCGFNAIARTYAAVAEQANANQVRRINKGAVDAESEAKYTAALTAHTRLRGQLESLADILALPPPGFADGLQGTSDISGDGSFVTRMLPTDDAGRRADRLLATSRGSSAAGHQDGAPQDAAGVSSTDVWDDDTEKDFYTNLLNLADAIPSCLLGVKEPPANGTTAVAAAPVVSSSSPRLNDGSISITTSCSNVPTAISSPRTSKGGPGGPVASSNATLSTDIFDSSEIQRAGGVSASGGTNPSQPGGPGAASLTPFEAKTEHKLLVLEQFFSTLCRATLASEVDTLAMKFFYEQMNVGKPARRRLVKLLMSTHRNDLHVLPTVSRFLATIGPFCKDVLQAVVDAVPRELRELVALRDPLKLDSQVKSARYVGELCKFRLLPPGTVLDLVNDLLGEFSQNNVETACHLIQCCGRFLAAEPGVGTRFQNIVQKMVRTKNNRNLPVHLELMVEDSYFQLFPSERRCKVPKELPVCRQFIHWLIFEELHRPATSLQNEETAAGAKKASTKTESKSGITRVLNSLRRLNWKDPLVCHWVEKAILNATAQVSYSCVGNIAQLLCSLVPGYPDFVISCVDNLLEQLQLSLEKNDYRDTPNRVRMIKLIGELFNYRLLDTTVILQTLYQLIGFSGPSSYGSETLDTARRLAVASGNHHLLLTDDEVPSTPPTASTTGVTGRHEALITTTVGVGVSQKNTGRQQSVAPLMEPTAPEDPPDDYFRLQLICVLLNVCGQYFSKGAAKDKMDRFLLFFHRYILLKGPLPTRLLYIVLDSLEAMRPKTSLYTTVDQVDTALREMFLRDAAERRARQMQALSETAELAHKFSESGAGVVDDRGSGTSNCDGTDEDDKEPSIDGELEMGDGADERSTEEEEVDEDEDDEEDEDDGEDESEDNEKISHDAASGGSASATEVDEDDDDECENRTTEEEKIASLQAQMFDLELSRIISQSVQEAKPAFGVGGQRGRIDTLLDDVRLPPVSKMERTKNDELAQDRLRVRLVTRRGNNTNKVCVKLLDIPKESRLCQAVYNKEIEDAKEHERLKKFVIDSVARHRKQELSDRQNEMKQQFFASSRYRGSGASQNAGGHYYGHRRVAQQRSGWFSQSVSTFSGASHKTSSVPSSFRGVS